MYICIILGITNISQGVAYALVTRFVLWQAYLMIMTQYYIFHPIICVYHNMPVPLTTTYLHNIFRLLSIHPHTTFHCLTFGRSPVCLPVSRIYILLSSLVAQAVLFSRSVSF